MKKYSFMVAMPTGLGLLRWSAAAYLFDMGRILQSHPLIDQIRLVSVASSRIMLNRNSIAQDALERGVDFLLMIDPDMKPDIYLNRRKAAKPFFHSSLQHLLDNPFGVVAAPAICDPPKCLTNVFVRDEETGKARRMTHEEAAARQRNPAIEQVVAIGTGIMLIHMPIFRSLEAPFFFDDYNSDCTNLERSQDINFTSRCTEAGIPVWCNHYAFAGHDKHVMLECPGIGDDEEEAKVAGPAEADPAYLPITLGRNAPVPPKAAAVAEQSPSLGG